MVFPVSGVETAVWVPPLVAFCISFFTSMAGVSGAFLLLPFQMSVLGFTSPAVSATNLVYNIVANPSGAWRYAREKRMFWPLTWMLLAGTIPGLVLGVVLRVALMPDARVFRVFVGLVLLYLGVSLLRDVARAIRGGPGSPPVGTASGLRIESYSWSMRRITCRFAGETHELATPRLLAVCFAVGLVSGAYGIGGGCLFASLFVVVFRLPVYIVAASTLMCNFFTSLSGVVTYQVAAPFFGGARVAPDWLLGLLLGVGGMAGIYLGARTQKHVRAHWIKLVLAAGVLLVAVRYLGWAWR